MDLKPLHEQTVVVFGASSGIGRETARCFAERGARVVISARDEAALTSLARDIAATGGEAVAHPADVTRFDEVQAVAETAVERFGGLDTWVHLAAVELWARFEDTTPEEFARVVQVNLVGQAHGAMAALPHLRRRGGGALIHVSSVEARRALPYQSAYAASKHGMIGFLDALRLELREEGAAITVTNVMPASINTPLFEKARTKLGVRPKPLPPVYQPVVVARAILHAAEHPTREIIAGGSGTGFVRGQALAPWLLDAILLRIGFNGQRSDEPKGEDAPDNLWEPLPGHAAAEGDFGDGAFSRSLYTSLATRPALRRAAAGAAAAAAAAWGVRALGGRH